MSQPAHSEPLTPRQAAYPYLLLTILCAALVAVTFAIQGNAGFSLWDEGFLWYGVQRVMADEVPIRDFMAYDPGRYYWSAALMSLYGDHGIMALRGTVAIFQMAGLIIGMVLLYRSSSRPNVLMWVLAAATLMVWMFPRHKLFDISISIALVGTLSFLVQQPTCRRYFLTGLIVGLVAVFGRNHGIYGVAACLGSMVYLWLGRESTSPSPLKAVAIWSAGVMIGYSPIMFMLAFIPNFAQAFWESIRFYFELKNTNLPLPLPWPWRVPTGQLPIAEIVQNSLIGSYFIAIAAFGLLGIVWVIRQRLRNNPVSAVLVACIFLALPYAHHAYSRADVSHLAQGIFPFLLGCLVLLANQPARTKWFLAALLCGSSLFVMLPQHPGWQCYSSQRCVATEISGDTLRVDSGTAGDLSLLHKLAEQFAPGDRSFVATPYWPGSYAVLERKSPVWEIYATVRRSEEFQRAEIERIKRADPGFAVILELPLDGRDELRFSNTHPHLEQYVRDHFEPVGGYAPNPGLQIYRKRQAQ